MVSAQVTLVHVSEPRVKLVLLLSVSLKVSEPISDVK